MKLLKWLFCIAWVHDYGHWEHKLHPLRAESTCNRCGKKGVYL